MKLRLNNLTFLASLLAVSLTALTAASQSSSKPMVLKHDVMQHVYCGFGIATTLQFPHDVDINQIVPGTPGFEVIKIYESQTVPNLVTIIPQVDNGTVNVNFTINGITYPFMVQIVDDSRVMATQSYTLAGLKSRREGNKLSRAPIMKPSEVDVPNTIKIIEKARTDHVFANSLEGKAVWKSINQQIPWNGNQIHIYDVVHFLEDDLMVMTIAWRNQSSNVAYYLNVQQYQVWLGQNRLYPTSSTQITDTVFPGQMDIAYLFFQGHRLNVNQNWKIKLPPEEKNIARLR